MKEDAGAGARPASDAGRGDDAAAGTDAPGFARNAPAPAEAARQPAVNLPWVVLALIGAFVAVHLLRTVILPEREAWRLTLELAFIPLRYSLPPEIAHVRLPGGLWTAVAAPVTHMFVHGGWGHLAVNSLWLAAFGSPVARRLGPLRFLALMAACGAGGALLYLLLHWGAPALLIGASGGISGLMGAAVRLVFAGGAGLAQGMRRDLSVVRPLTLAEALLDPRPRAFILIWLAINLVFGLIGIGSGEQVSAIAWEAHLGGFLTGLVAFPLFDAPRRSGPAGQGML